MNERATAVRRGSYGIDAPYWAAFFILMVIVYIVAAAITRSVAMCLAALFLLGIAASASYTTRRGKFRVWAELIDGLGLRGDERILDLGCGRGAVLLMVAQRLTTGRAVGVDLWRG